MIEKAAGAAVVLTALMAGCTWVAVTGQGAQVHSGVGVDLSACERLGRVTTQTRDRIGFYTRSATKVQGELLTLARNEAADMGGELVVMESAVQGGKQSFGVYRCDGKRG